MLDNFIPLIESFLPMFDYALWYYFALCFVITVPCMIKMLVRRS